MSQQIAFIGLGNMGGPMAANLVKAGHQVRVFDLSASALQAAAAAGCEVVDSARAAAEGAQVVITMLPADQHVHSVYFGSDGIASILASHTLCIDCSTISAEMARTIAKQLAARGITFIDAPVSGGVAGAQAGTLAFMCGGGEAAVEQARPILAAMGKNIFRAGDSGAGQVAKMCNNMLLSVLMVGTAEALQLGLAHGLDAKVLADIMLQSSGRNWTLEVYNPCPGVQPNSAASRGYTGGFMVDLMSKDLGLAQRAAVSIGAVTPMGALTHNLFRSWSQLGHGQEDFSSIFNYLKPIQK